jgi:hypothetical protein
MNRAKRQRVEGDCLMNEQTAQKQRYMVRVNQREDAGEGLVFTFVPKPPEPTGGPRATPKRAPEFVVAVRQVASGLAFDWSGTPNDPGAARGEIEAEITARMTDRSVWIERVTALVGQVEQWAKELNWSTRRLEKTLDDARIGKHRVPALLMQENTCRVLLEPIARSAPGAEGVVDLYLMPAYDDIAVLFYYSDRWNVHHDTARGTNTVVPVRDSEAMPLSKEKLEKVLAEMMQNAA